MNSVERVRAICKERKIPISKLERDLGYGNGYISQLRRGMFPAKRLYAIAEYYGARTPAETLAEKVIALAGREVVTCDAADPRMISQLQRLNVNAIGCKKGPGSREHGFRWLQDLGAIIIDPKRTPNIAREFRKYEYAQDRNGNFLSEYPDKDDHSIDSTRYALERMINMREAKTFSY